MHLLKSEKARLELTSKQRTLSVRERSVLFLADGIRTKDELVWLLRGDADMLQRLMAAGYLLPANPINKNLAAQLTGFAVPQTVAPNGNAGRSTPAVAPAALLPMTMQEKIASSSASQDTESRVATSSSDTFEGKRSLATTRMFLFDIVERLFVRKLPELAVTFRDQLRNAKDRESMLAIAREIINRVEDIAGAERADGLSERLAMMLPIEH